MKREIILLVDDNQDGEIIKSEFSGYLVRCKDCKYRIIDNDVVRYNCGLHLVVNLNDSDFCSRGERKEDAETN